MPARSNVHFVFVGDGADRSRLEQLAAARALKNVQFVGRHPASEMPAFMRAADALLVHLRPSEIADYAIPTKILSYLAAARPILCAAGGASAELVRDAEAGLITEPGDAIGLAAAVGQLASMAPQARAQLGEHGHRYLATNLEKGRVIDFYEQTLMELAQPPHSPAVAAGQRT